MASEKEIRVAVKAARDKGAKKIILLKCTSEYPASVKDSNLVTIPYMKKFDCPIGLSDHSEGIGSSHYCDSLRRLHDRKTCNP